jgi:ABC-2 type transport system ATP-binding protein
MRVGKLVSQGTLGALRAAAAPRVHVRTADPGAAAAELRRTGLTAVTVHSGEAVADLGAHAPEDVLRALVLAGVPVREFRVDAADLEDVFVALTGEGFDVSG